RDLVLLHFHDTATTEIYTLSLHDALPISIPHAPAPAAEDQKSELIPAEPELDIKVHCVVSCLCHPLKLHDIDHRALYFGVWDAEIFIDENYALSYHAPMVDHEFFTNWYERLYGVKVE